LPARANALAVELSAGERQRTAIARALANDPDFVLVDEPTSNLDSERGRQVVDALGQEAHDRQIAIVMVTHDLEMARQADRVLEMRDGRIERRS
jgi:ABC-type lipoprotein export system ATPase subunit